MTDERKGVVRMLAVAFAAMLAIPLAYRVWITFHPPSSSESFSLDEFFARATAERSVRLLTTPLRKWTPADRTAEPKLAAWLEEHAKVVLPWEWSKEAREKDPKGYRKSWDRLLDEAESALDRSLSLAQRERDGQEREFRIVRTLYGHMTNQAVSVERNLATNSLPATVSFERLSKGRLWGWNRKTERRPVSDGRQAADLVAELSARARELKSRLENARRSADALKRNVCALERQRSTVDGLRKRFSDWSKSASDNRDLQHDETVREAGRVILSVVREACR